MKAPKNIQEQAKALSAKYPTGTVIQDTEENVGIVTGYIWPAFIKCGKYANKLALEINFSKHTGYRYEEEISNILTTAEGIVLHTQAQAHA